MSCLVLPTQGIYSFYFTEVMEERTDGLTGKGFPLTPRTGCRWTSKALLSTGGHRWETQPWGGCCPLSAVSDIEDSEFLLHRAHNEWRENIAYR